MPISLVLGGTLTGFEWFAEPLSRNVGSQHLLLLLLVGSRALGSGSQGFEVRTWRSGLGTSGVEFRGLSCHDVIQNCLFERDWSECRDTQPAAVQTTDGVRLVVYGLCRKVDVRLPGKENSNSHGARLVHLIITSIYWIRTIRLSIKSSLSLRFMVHRIR